MTTHSFTGPSNFVAWRGSHGMGRITWPPGEAYDSLWLWMVPCSLNSMMASGCAAHIPCLRSPSRRHRRPSYSSSPTIISPVVARGPRLSVPDRPAPKSSPQTYCKNPGSPPVETSAHDSDVLRPYQSVKNPEPDPSSVPSFLVYLSTLSRRFRGALKTDRLGMEILSVALPAALALAADPIASLVDTAIVGHLGSVELAAVGVSVSVFNLVSKLFNVPLLNITTSFAAEECALITGDCMVDSKCKKVLPSVSTSLALATSIGIVEAVALFFGSGFLLNIMGIPVDSPMHTPAEHFLSLRAFGAPPLVVALAAQGTFRGFMDTKTPLYAIVAGNLLNALLDLILIFFFGLGISGAAIATVTSEYVIAFILLRKLNGRVSLITPNIDGWRFSSYLKSAGLLISRTLAALGTMTLATSMAAREGPIQMAGHQICLQVWLAVSLLTDSLALAGQALLASSYSQRNYVLAQQIIHRVLQIGLIAGTMFGVILFFGFGAFSSLFSTDSMVLEVASSGIWFVAGCQPINAMAFAIDGLYYGVKDFDYAAYSMLVVGLISSAALVLSAPSSGLLGVWFGLSLFMTLRVAAGLLRFGTRSGPWKMIWSRTEQEGE